MKLGTIEQRARDFYGRVPSDAIKLKPNVVILVDQDGIWRYVEHGRGEIDFHLTGKIACREHLHIIGEACSQWALA